jgi:hypothetical protein
MTAQTAEYQHILGRARSLAPELRLTLAEELLRTLHADVRSSVPWGVPAAQMRGLAGGGTPPDEAIRPPIEEHRTEKYG